MSTMETVTSVETAADFLLADGHNTKVMIRDMVYDRGIDSLVDEYVSEWVNPAADLAAEQGGPDGEAVDPVYPSRELCREHLELALAAALR